MPATVTTYGRITAYGDLAAVRATIDASGLTYATASGGASIDLQPVLTQGAPFSMPYINPADVIGLISLARSAAGAEAGTLVCNPANATYGSAVYPYAGGSASAIHPANALLTAPATLRIFANGGAEIADGAIAANSKFDVLILIARGGPNA